MRAALLPAFLLAGCASAEAPTRWSLTAAAAEGPVHGFVQTPKGGAPGTTSYHRPRLSELGIDRAAFPDVRLCVSRGNDELSLEARFLRLSGGAVLQEPLVSYDTFFPAGTDVDASIDMDTWWLGYGRRVPLSDAARLDLVPGGGLMLWQFDYRISPEDLPESRRAYAHVAPFLSARLEWNPEGRFRLEGSARASLPVGTGPFDVALEARASFRIWGDSKGGGRLFLGVSHERVSKKDNQPVPNDVEITIGPAILGGIEIDF